MVPPARAWGEWPVLHTLTANLTPKCLILEPGRKYVHLSCTGQKRKVVKECASGVFVYAYMSGRLMYGPYTKIKGCTKSKGNQS